MHCRRKNKVYWECTVRPSKTHRCPATVVQHGSVFERGRNAHIHEPATGLLTAVDLRRDVRRRAKDDIFASASVIVTAALNGINTAAPAANLPMPSNMVSCDSFAALCHFTCLMHVVDVMLFRLQSL